jgi:hypothetical protein
MSLNPEEFTDLGEGIPTTQDIRIISGAYVATADQFIQDTKNAITTFIINAIQETNSRLQLDVARKTGEMRAAITKMFVAQIEKLNIDQDVRLIFDRQQLDLPHYLKYHDIEWALNPKFNRTGYKFPTTPNTRPFSEKEFMDTLYFELIKAMQVEFIKKGFSFTIRGISI